jgi:hypothetical protein
MSVLAFHENAGQFQPYFSLSDMRSVQVGCLDSAGAATYYGDLLLRLETERLSQGNDAVTGTRRDANPAAHPVRSSPVIHWIGMR